MPAILSFDVSSTTIAYSLLDCVEKGKLLDFGYIKPIKSGSIIERLADTKTKIVEIFYKFCPDYIAIEDVIEFMQGASSSKTIITLAVFNRMVGLAAQEFNVPPYLMNIMTIRHCIKKQFKLKQLPKKEEIPDLLEKHWLHQKFPWEFSKKGKIRMENYDVSDAIAVGFACMIKNGL